MNVIAICMTLAGCCLPAVCEQTAEASLETAEGAQCAFDPVAWRIVNYKDLLTVDAAGDSLKVSGAKKKCDTAWSATSSRSPLPEGTRELKIQVFVKSSRGLGNQNAAADHSNIVEWFGEDGVECGSSPLHLPCPSSSKPIRVWDVLSVPANARSFSIRLGFDRPDLGPSDALEYSRLSCVCIAAAGRERPGIEIPDLHVPSIEVAGEGRFAIRDGSGVDAASVRISIVGEGPAQTRREGDVWVIDGRRWPQGLHVAEIEAANMLGNATREKRAFYVGPTPKVANVALRDDGVILRDGRPFFPIGAYNVKKDGCNGHDLDRAFADLRAAGFNFAHTYEDVLSGQNAGIMDVAHRHGFSLFISAREAWRDPRFEKTIRHHPAVLAWYLADDTADNTSPEELRFLDSVSKALDPSRPTCQADAIPFAGLEHMGVSRYSNYVSGSDICMPEIYPIRSDTTNDTHRLCVARIRSDMRMARRDIERCCDGRPRAIWPILQAFQGWVRWPWFPTSSELYAMSFAALAEGAQGITWYTYSGWGKNYGFAARPDYFAAMRRVSARIGELIPFLMARTEAGGAKVRILSGPDRDPKGHVPVVCLVKRLGGVRCMIAVNSAPEPVAARFDLSRPTSARRVRARWENRDVETDGAGFVDSFEPFGVHVYEIEEDHRGRLLLSFDDDFYEGWRKALPLLAGYGAHATFFVSGGLDGQALSEVKNLAAHGHTIGLHGVRHVNVPLEESAESVMWYYDAEILPQVEASRRHGISAACFAYPNGRSSAFTDEMICSRDVRRVRGTGGKYRPFDPEGTKKSALRPLAEIDDLYVSAFDVARGAKMDGVLVGRFYNTDVAEIAAFLKRAAERRATVSLISHDIADEPTGIGMRTEWLEEILETASSEGLEIVGYDELDKERCD